jgi:hypothetical protein
MTTTATHIRPHLTPFEAKAMLLVLDSADDRALTTAEELHALRRAKAKLGAELEQSQ